MYWIIVIGCLLYPSLALGLDIDGSYTSTDGRDQIAASGKHWVNQSLRVDGRYNKVEGDQDRYTYGILSRQLFSGVLFENEGRVYDTHKLISGSAGLGYRSLSLSAGATREFPLNQNHETFGLGRARLSNWKLLDVLSLDAFYTYLWGDKTRHDYGVEGRIGSKKVYVGGRYEHIRNITIKGVIIGVRL